MNSAFRLTFSTLLLGAALLAGCKKSAPAPGANAMVATNQESADGTPSGPVSGRFASQAPAPDVVVEDNGDVNANLSQLSLELRKYVMRTRSVPRTFEEFVSKSHAQVPPPPPGKKYAIDGQAVVLKKS